MTPKAVEQEIKMTPTAAELSTISGASPIGVLYRQVRARPTLLFAGQMSGVEGYVESASSGLLAGLNAAALARGTPVSALPRTTAIGALAYYVSHADPAHYEPSNITFGIMEPLDLRQAQVDPEHRRGVERAPRSKMARKLAVSERALADLQTWLHARASQNVPQVSGA